MNPPLRASRKSTSRMLLTRALMTRPRMSKRMMSPTLMANRSWMPFSTDTSGSVDDPVQNAPAMIRSFGSRWSR